LIKKVLMSRLFQCTSNYLPINAVASCRKFSTSERRSDLLTWIRHRYGKYRIPWEYLHVRRKIAEACASRYKFERVTTLGPDFACLEWLMKCGATSVNMTDGTAITTQKQMREFIGSHGIDVKKKDLKPLCDVKQLTGKELEPILKSDILYKKRWANVPQVFIKAVDASDSVVADPGFQYFRECYKLEKLVLNFCDFFGDDAIHNLCSGRAIYTLEELELIMNPNLSDVAFYSIAKLSALKRAHFYFNPYVINESAAKQLVRVAVPKCYITYPEVVYIGTGK